LPSIVAEKGKMITDFVNGPPSFSSFDEILERTIRFNPTRSESSLRRGILHNAAQQPDGSWVWRHSRQRLAPGASRPRFPDRFAWLWDVIGGLTVPLMLVRGLEHQSVLADEHESELLTRLPSARVERVAAAGHSVQGDQPLVLARLISDFVP
jgi:esterase